MKKKERQVRGGRGIAVAGSLERNHRKGSWIHSLSILSQLVEKAE
jgi:hypothetical protein